jgi:hypothetical protein
MVAMEYHSCVWVVLVLEIFKRVAGSSFRGFPFFLYFPYTNSCILSFIIRVSLVILVLSLCLGDSSTLSSYPSSCSCSSLNLSVL